jgi:hypothetical protein
MQNATVSLNMILEKWEWQTDKRFAETLGSHSGLNLVEVLDVIAFARVAGISR